MTNADSNSNELLSIVMDSRAIIRLDVGLHVAILLKPRSLLC